MKVGTRVKEFKLEFKETQTGWDSDMSNYCGKEAVITRDVLSDNTRFRLDIDQGNWYWDKDFLEEISETPFQCKEGIEVNVYSFYDDLFTTGMVKPEEILVNQYDIERVREAMKVLEGFHKAAEEQGILNQL